MIPNRLLLRAATVLALTRGGDGPYPTMAGEAVFDTKLKPITDIAQETMVPVILVYTDADARLNKERNATRNWKRTIDLVIEIAISSLGPDKAEWAETDAELEAILDLFEAEVETALMDVTNQWANYWRKLVRCMDSWESTPYRSAEQTVRYAVRQIHIECEVQTDCFPSFTTETPKFASLIDKDGKFIPGSLLPIPYLAQFESEVLANDELFKTTRDLLQGVTHQPVLPALKRIGLKIDAIDPADPNRLPVGQTHGPDGRIEVEAMIEDLDK